VLLDLSVAFTEKRFLADLGYLESKSDLFNT